jgi:hypothetical protein
MEKMLKELEEILKNADEACERPFRDEWEKGYDSGIASGIELAKDVVEKYKVPNKIVNSEKDREIIIKKMKEDMVMYEDKKSLTDQEYYGNEAIASYLYDFLSSIKKLLGEE